MHTKAHCFESPIRKRLYAYLTLTCTKTRKTFSFSLFLDKFEKIIISVVKHKTIIN